MNVKREGIDQRDPLQRIEKYCTMKGICIRRRIIISNGKHSKKTTVTSTQDVITTIRIRDDIEKEYNQTFEDTEDDTSASEKGGQRKGGWGAPPLFSRPQPTAEQAAPVAFSSSGHINNLNNSKSIDQLLQVDICKVGNYDAAASSAHRTVRSSWSSRLNSPPFEGNSSISGSSDFDNTDNEKLQHIQATNQRKRRRKQVYHPSTIGAIVSSPSYPKTTNSSSPSFVKPMLLPPGVSPAVSAAACTIPWFGSVDAATVAIATTTVRNPKEKDCSTCVTPTIVSTITISSSSKLTSSASSTIATSSLLQPVATNRLLRDLAVGTCHFVRYQARGAKHGVCEYPVIIQKYLDNRDHRRRNHIVSDDHEHYAQSERHGRVKVRYLPPYSKATRICRVSELLEETPERHEAYKKLLLSFKKEKDDKNAGYSRSRSSNTKKMKNQK